MSTSLDPAAPDERRQEVLDFCAHWPPILQAQREGVLDLSTLSSHDQEFLATFNVPAMLGWGRAMLDWPAVEPADIRCPALWLIGTEDHPVMETYRNFEASLAGSNVRAQILDGLDHNQVFDQIDHVFPTMLAFTRA